MRLWRWYVQQWRECFGADDIAARFFVRLEILALHAAICTALVLLLAWGHHFWRLYVR